MKPLKIAKKTKAYISLALVLLCTPVMAKGEDLSQVIRLANQGDAYAQSSLGFMYAKGKGVRQDYRKAKERFGLSCDNGYQLGCDAYKHLNQKGY